MNNQELYDAAMQAITELFSDKSVSISECRENLESLKGEIDVFLSALDTDEE